jgi:hypothetical protein
MAKSLSFEEIDALNKRERKHIRDDFNQSHVITLRESEELGLLIIDWANPATIKHSIRYVCNQRGKIMYITGDWYNAIIKNWEWGASLTLSYFEGKVAASDINLFDHKYVNGKVYSQPFLAWIEGLYQSYKHVTTPYNVEINEKGGDD